MDFINIHTHRFSSDEKILEIVNQYPNEFTESIPNFSIGIHPWYIDENRIDDDLKIIESKLQQKNCLAIGECGLDKRIEKPMDLQAQVFESQLALAEKHQKPAIIHCVAAFQEVIETKKRLNISIPMIIHGFSKNEHTAKQLLDNGFYLSFGKYLLRNPELESVFKSVPNDRFFLETDTIEENIADLYALAAKYKSLQISDLQQQIKLNFKTVFESE
ncbi:TatD family hydrolase [Flavobacterium noncentrifugens]|uniref:TatD DNase family protein n=1 Tax=Flavobacterium noncentrifugens TaxID=1128970 RepID=A0A1G8WIN9_9FLAO|nr:TatD family hydrolase [Flavobacterium noncentrifugens]GEP50943.1 TatD family hydrolase [Flavobacterium noncentrifugens]SDJ77996.1 TatD DNase family protein [Flavobacterium noncentrifugens]